MTPARCSDAPSQSPPLYLRKTKLPEHYFNVIDNQTKDRLIYVFFDDTYSPGIICLVDL